ncbi:unnamed protein product [Penicillium glandicola]
MALVISFLLSMLLDERSSSEEKPPDLPIFTITIVKSHFELHPGHQKFAEAVQVWDRHGPERNVGWIQFPSKTWAGGDGENESDSLEILFAECSLECSFASFVKVDFEQVLAVEDVEAFIAHLFGNM